MRRRVPLGPAGLSVDVGDHVCALYRGSDGRDALLLPYLQAGLQAGDKCVAILDQADPDDVTARLDDSCDARTAVESHQLDIRCSSEAYLRGGVFSKPEMLDFWSDVVETGMGEGYSFTRSVGEMTWALRDMPGVEGLVDYEADLNRFLPQYPQVIVCLYDLDRFDGSLVVDLLRTHPKLLLRGSVIDNPYYLEPEEFLSADGA